METNRQRILPLVNVYVSFTPPLAITLCVYVPQVLVRAPSKKYVVPTLVQFLVFMECTMNTTLAANQLEGTFGANSQQFHMILPSYSLL